ncbi:MAG: PIN domain-containing protein [Saprospiraceae bacterium]
MFAIKLRQKRAITLADAIIVATALVHNLTLLTENTKDYARIEGLRLLTIKDLIEQ